MDGQAKPNTTGSGSPNKVSNKIASPKSSILKFMRQASSKPIAASSSFGSKINIVTESCSFIPSTIASTYSLEVAQSPELRRRSSDGRKLGDLGEAVQISTSYQDQLEQLERLEDPSYTDTVQSTDSTASLLRRTFSLPHDYHYSKRTKHARDIFQEMDEEQQHAKHNVFRGTMEDLLEKPEYIDSLESTSSRKLLLARAALEYARSRRLEPCPEVSEVDDAANLKRSYTKNLFILSVSYMLAFTAFLSMRNLQSSINSDIGLMSLCVLYASLFISCIFTTSLVQWLRPRNTMLLCFMCLSIYAAANFYPHYYVLLPASAVAGFALANSYTAQATYLANIAMGYASVSGKGYPYVLTRFNGIYYMFFQLAQIIGGVVSSVLLSTSSRKTESSMGIESLTLSHDDVSLTSTYFSTDSVTIGGTESWNNTHLVTETVMSTAVVLLSGDEISTLHDSVSCGAGYCAHTSVQGGADAMVSTGRLYILVGVFLLCSLLAALLLWLCLDPLEGEMKSRHGSLSAQLLACFRFFRDLRVICLLPLMFYSLLQVSFMFGEFSKAFVTCSSGVHMVGLVMLTISSLCASSSYVNGRLSRRVDRKLLIPLGYVVHISMLTFMLVYTPTLENRYVMFIIAGTWGVADGIFVTQVVSLFGVLFMDNKEPAFAGLKMCQASAVCTFFLLSPHLCTSVKIIGLGVMAVLALTGYVCLELLLHRRNRPPSPAHVLKNIGPTSV